MPYDLSIFQAINGLAGQCKIFDWLGIFFAQYSQYFLIAILIVFLFRPKKDQQKNRIMIAVALTSAIVARLIIKNIIVFSYTRPRPYMVLSSAHKLISTSLSENFQSFPSGHTIFFFALSMALYFYNKKLGIFSFIVSILMGVARVFVGVHWLSDIIGGLILGVIVAYICHLLYLKYRIAIESIVDKLISRYRKQSL